MMSKKEFRDWVATLDEEGFVAIDDDCMSIVELDDDGETTGAYLEIGGTPVE